VVAAGSPSPGEGPQAFAALLQRHRLAAGLSQAELAERAGLSQRGISDLERGLRQAPYPATLRRLAEALGLPEPERSAFLAANRRGGQPATSQAPTAASPAAAGTLAAMHPPADVAPAVPLPMVGGELLGRQREQTQARALLVEGARLLTLTGPGGVGKTRLALAIADELAGDIFPGGARFADLSPLRDAALVPVTIARAFGAAWDGQLELARVLGPVLRGRPTLLVLDNCEQVLAGARAIGSLLDAVPELVVLATSREPLRLLAEYELPVPPLPVPPVGAGPTLAELTSNPALQLFARRAQAVDPSFRLTDANVRSVAELCVRLDGLPLALELAAARTRLLSPAALLERLGARLGLHLEARALDVPARQRTLWATLAWSHDLLTTEEQTLFRRLAVFAGGWTLEATETVCSGDSSTSAQVLDLLGRLLDQSLVTAEDSAGERRYRLLEPIREYAAAWLTDPAEQAAVEGRHADWCLRVAETGARAYWSHYRLDGLAQLEFEHDNMRAALRLLIRHGDADRGLRLGTALYCFWYLHGHFGEGRAWLTRLLELPAAAVTSAARATALSYLGQLAYCQSAFAQAEASLEESRALFEALGDRAGLALALLLLGNNARGRGDLERARRLYEQAAPLQDERWAFDATTRYVLAETMLELGDSERAAELATEALGRHRARQHEWGMARSLEVLGRIAGRRDEHAEARALLEQALALQRQIGDIQGLVVTLTTLAQDVADQGEPDRALALAQEALRLAWDSGNLVGVARALERLTPMLADPHPEAALQLAAAATALRARLGARPYPAEGARLEHWLEAVRLRLGDAKYRTTWTVGQAKPIDQIVADLRPTVPSEFVQAVAAGASHSPPTDPAKL
jgi:predicted ATPase/transcriptional regulator with XRE-family HTH domain/uncharacterized protein HemY